MKNQYLIMLGRKFRSIILFFKGLSLTKKLFLSYIVVLAIPVIVFGILFINNIRNNTIMDAMDRSKQDIQQIRIHILKNIDVLRSASQTVISNKKFIETLGTKKEYSTVELMSFQTDVLSNIDNIKYINTDINRLRVYIENEYLPEFYPTINYETYVLNEAWYRNVMELHGAMYWRMNHIEDIFKKYEGTDENEVISLYRQIEYGSDHVGVIEVNMLTAIFFGNLYTSENSPDSIICVLEDKEYMYWDSNNIFFNNEQTDPDYIRQQFVQNITGEEGFFIIGGDIAQFGVTYAYIDTLDSYVCKIISFGSINSAINTMQNQVLIGIMSLILLLSLVTYSITSILFKKLRIIVSSIRKVQEGEIFIDIPVQGNDEISELSRHFQIMLNKINELIYTVVRKQASAKDAEIRSLQSQINAHFIYNVLESIKMIAVVEYKYEISDALTTLGRLMQYSMNWKRQYVLLEEEIKYIKNYIRLLNLRFDEGIVLKIEIEPHLMQHEILKMLLQPLIENAVNHGLAPKDHRGTITIKIFNHDKNLIIDITDDGAGINAQKLNELNTSLKTGDFDENEPIKGNGIALGNTNERIRLFYGEESSIEISSTENEYTRVRIKLPFMMSKNMIG